MASSTSNSGEITRCYASLADALNLKRHASGGKQRFGDDLTATAAMAIEHRTVDLQEDPTGAPLKKLKERTIARKLRAGMDTRILIETHTMLALDQIQGKPTITSNTAIMQAGLDDETRAKVAHSHTAEGNRPERPFYDLGADGQEAVDDLVQDVIAYRIREASR